MYKLARESDVNAVYTVFLEVELKSNKWQQILIKVMFEICFHAETFKINIKTKSY